MFRASTTLYGAGWRDGEAFGELNMGLELGRWRSNLGYMIALDDYWPKNSSQTEAARRVDLDVRAALEGLATGWVRARVDDVIVELLFPRAADWVRTGNGLREGRLEELGELDRFVDVRNLRGDRRG